MATVDALVPGIRALGLPHRVPVLRGHGGQPRDLESVTWRDWYADAGAALDQLLVACERVAIVGLSMGGAVALHLAARRGDRLAGVVAIAPALRLRGTPRDQMRLALLALAGRHITVDARNAYEDSLLAAQSTNYPHVPARAVLSLARYGRIVERAITRIQTPLLVVYAPHDRVVEPRAARLVFERASTPPAEKLLVAFPGSGHEMLRDREAPAVVAAVLAFISRVAAGRERENRGSR